jgi:hypothetical protein
VLYYDKRDLSKVINSKGVYFGEGRGEVGICLHLPLEGHVAGGAPQEDFMLMLSVANDLIEFLLYKRLRKGPEAWDYDAEKASEVYTVCGDNPSIGGIVIFDRNYNAGPKLQVFLDKTFGSNEVAVRWKNQLVGDETLIGDYQQYMIEMLSGGATASDAKGAS